jgi:PAS domain S-box-containing protein
MDVDLGGDVVIVTDGEGTIVDVNDAFVHVTGYSRQDAIGATPRLLSSGLQQPAIYEEMWQSVLDGAVWSGQLVDRHRDGSLRTHQVTLTPRVGPNGKVDRIIAVQRNLSHDLARESGVPGIGSLHTDRSGRCVYVSGEAARLLGGDADALYAHGWRDRLFEDDQAAALEAVDTALETGREQRIDARTQTSNWLHLRIVPLRAPDGTDIGTSWSLEDVTDLIDLHRRLSRRDALVTALLESHEDPVAFVDPSGTILATNTAWSRTTADEHPALATTTGDNLLDRLRQMGADGDPTATEVARGVTAQITGVPAIGRADRRLLATPIHSEEGGAVLRLPQTPGAT